MADLLQVNYDEMQGIIKMLENEKGEVEQLFQQTKQMAESLHGSQWVGEAADRFFDEMNNFVFPRTQKMIYALDVAGDVAKQIVQIINQADEETKGFFSSLGG